MDRTTTEARFVEEVVERDGQNLAEPCRQGLEESRASRVPGKAHQPMAELVGGPLGPVCGMETPDDPIVLKRTVLGLRQHSASPTLGCSKIGPTFRLPFIGQLQVQAVLEVREQ
jgi:hypothetical protein